MAPTQAWALKQKEAMESPWQVHLSPSCRQALDLDAGIELCMTNSQGEMAYEQGQVFYELTLQGCLPRLEQCLQAQALGRTGHTLSLESPMKGSSWKLILRLMPRASPNPPCQDVLPCITGNPSPVSKLTEPENRKQIPSWDPCKLTRP